MLLGVFFLFLKHFSLPHSSSYRNTPRITATYALHRRYVATLMEYHRINCGVRTRRVQPRRAFLALGVSQHPPISFTSFQRGLELRHVRLIGDALTNLSGTAGTLRSVYDETLYFMESQQIVCSPSKTSHLIANKKSVKFGFECEALINFK